MDSNFKNNEIYVIKLNAGTDILYVLSKWSEENVQIKIIDEQFVKKWVGVLNKEFMQLAALDLKLSYLEFRSECKEALSTNNRKECFSYMLKNGIFKLQKCKHFKITYFEIELEPTFDKIEKELLDSVVNKLECQENILNKKDEELNHLRAEMANLIFAFEKCKTEKNELETTLFSKFAMLLNSKKKRISKLENILHKAGIELKYCKTNGDQMEIEEKDVRENSLFEENVADDPFEAETQIISEKELQRTIMINLPKRQRIAEQIASTSKNSAALKLSETSTGSNFQICGQESTSAASPSVSGENSSEEYFAKM